MRKKILIAVDTSVHSRNALDYAIFLAERIENMDFVLFNIQPMISQYLLEEAVKNHKSKKMLEAVYENNRQASHQLLETCRQKLIDRGIQADCIEMKTQPRANGIADDILSAAENGSYDAIMVGRRGIRGLQDLFIGSVASHVIQKISNGAVWITS